jgi:hypothetical protein
VETTYPEDLTPNAADLATATEHRVSAEAELPKFRDNALAKGRVAADWHAAFRTWLRNARKFADERAAAAGNPGAAPGPNSTPTRKTYTTGWQ